MELIINLEDFEKSAEILQNHMNLYNKAIDDGIDEIVQRMEKKIVQLANEYGVPQRAVGNPYSVKIPNGYMIMLGSDDKLAEFFEFGTGIKGKNNPNPNANIYGWVYDVNGHGESGWWYPTDESDPNPHKWVDGSGQLRGWTRGKVSHPFMYNTYLYGRRIAKKTINKHIKRVIPK